eukprot:11872796-Karenia_brevis.AAC.1
MVKATSLPDNVLDDDLLNSLRQEIDSLKVAFNTAEVDCLFAIRRVARLMGMQNEDIEIPPGTTVVTH